MKRLVSLAVSAALIAGTVFSLNTVALAEEVQHNDKSEEVQNFSKSNSYSDYVKDYKFADAEDIVLFDGSVLCKKETSFENTVSIPSDAWYNIEITYKSTENDTGEINFALLIDGAYPFEEAGQYTLPRLYQDDGEVRSDGLGNEFTPMQKEVYLQQTILLSNFSTFTTEASKFFFSKGEHTLTFEDFTCDAEIISVRLVSVEQLLDYETVLASYPKAENYDGEELLFEGEDAVYKSSSDLVAKSDSTTPAVYPTDPFVQRVNYIGSNWSDTGEEITWKINVEKSGLYKLSFHFRQNYILNGNSYRSIKIDGKIPFEEAGMVAFPYGNGWQTMTVSDNEGEAYLFYLEEGTHTFSMSVTLGPLSSFCTELEDIVYEIGAWYRKIVMITGETPDSNRDYNLFSQIGGLEDGLQSIVEDIEELVNYYEQLTGVSGGSTVSVLNSMKNSINSMLKYKYKAQQYKSSYYSNYSSVSATLYELMDMPLDIDTVVLSSPEKEVEKGNVSVFSKMSYSFKRFMASFAVDYNNISGDTQTDQEIVLSCIQHSRFFYVSSERIVGAY